MTPICGLPTCHGAALLAVTGRDKRPFSNLKVSRPFTLNVTENGEFYSVKMMLSQLSRRHGIKIFLWEM